MAISDLFKNLSTSSAESITRNNTGIAIANDQFSKPFVKRSSSPQESINQSRSLVGPPPNNRFPSDLGEDFISLRFMKYKRPNPAADASYETTYNVYLPIPRVLTEQHTVNLAPQSLKTIGVLANEIDSMQDLGLNQLGNAIAGTSSLGAGSLNKELTNSVGTGLFSGISQYYTDSSRSIGIFSGEQVVGRIQQSLGFIPNPHMSVFFNGVDLRPAMEFSWILTPRNAAESDEMRAILKSIRGKVLPRISRTGGNIMDYPDMIIPTIYLNGQESDMVPKYKKGLISALAINYTPNGPSFFRGTNSPTFIAFSFLFQEIEIFTSEDYDDTVAKAQEKTFSSPLLKLDSPPISTINQYPVA